MTPALAQLLLLAALGDDPRLNVALLRLGLQLIMAREASWEEESPFPLLAGEDVIAILHPDGGTPRVPREASSDPAESDEELVAKLQSQRLRRYLEGA